MSFDDNRVDLPKRTCPRCGKTYFMRRETCAACRGVTHGTVQHDSLHRTQRQTRCDVSGVLMTED